MQDHVDELMTLTHAAQNETDPLLKQVFVYDFVEEANLGW
jgi:hypothetical protein